MRKFLPLISFLGLAAVIVPPSLYLFGQIGKEPMATVMIVGTLLWFASVPFWMGRREAQE